MPSIIRVFSLFLIHVIALSCKSEGQFKLANPLQEDEMYLQQYRLEQSGTLRFELDSLTAPITGHLQLYDKEDKIQLVFLNDELGAIYFNDLKTGRTIKRLQMEGDPKKSKKRFQGFYIHNQDSIFLFTNNPSIFLVDGKGTVLNEFSFSSTVGRNNVSVIYRGIYVATSSPPYLDKHTLYISSVVVGDLQRDEVRPVLISLDIKSGKTNVEALTFPKEYNQSILGDVNMFIHANTVNPIQRKLLYSFPASHNLEINNFGDTKVTSKFAGSRYIKYIKEYEESDYKGAPSGAPTEYFMTNGSYGGIYYDKYRDFYYRIAYLPVESKNINYEDKNRPLKGISVIILDKDLKYLGETLLEKNVYWSSNIFVSQEGFNIQNRNKTDQTLDFTTFSIRKVQ